MKWKDKKVLPGFPYFSKYLEYYYIPSISEGLSSYNDEFLF